LKLLKVNFLKNNFSESGKAQKVIDKPSPMGLGTLRNRGVVQNGWFARVTSLKKPGEIQNVHIVNSLVSGAKTPNRSGIREFRSEFHRNLQTSRPPLLSWSALT
jgi:hypothetical protein